MPISPVKRKKKMLERKNIFNLNIDSWIPIYTYIPVQILWRCNYQEKYTMQNWTICKIDLIVYLYININKYESTLSCMLKSINSLWIPQILKW